MSTALRFEGFREDTWGIAGFINASRAFPFHASTSICPACLMPGCYWHRSKRGRVVGRCRRNACRTFPTKEGYEPMIGYVEELRSLPMHKLWERASAAGEAGLSLLKAKERWKLGVQAPDGKTRDRFEGWFPCLSCGGLDSVRVSRDIHQHIYTSCMVCRSRTFSGSDRVAVIMVGTLEVLQKMFDDDEYDHLMRLARRMWKAHPDWFQGDTRTFIPTLSGRREKPVIPASLLRRWRDYWLKQVPEEAAEIIAAEAGAAGNAGKHEQWRLKGRSIWRSWQTPPAPDTDSAGGSRPVTILRKKTTTAEDILNG